MAKSLKIFYATDIHGSETCFMKFVNSAKFYKVDVLIMGGDITGKMLIPVKDHGDGTVSLNFLGKNLVLSADELPAVEKQIRQTGYYPYRSTPEEVARMEEDPTLVSTVFSHTMTDGLRRWLDIAEDRLRGTGVRMFLTPGNDDGLAVDDAFVGDTYVVNPEGRVVELDDRHEMISSGYANITPWDCPRDVSEEDLAARIAAMTERVRSMDGCVFNLHCPPHGSELDSAPKLDETLRPVIGAAGMPLMVPVGSTAVADAIRKHQPLLGLHGHIHESKGIMSIGRTTVLNPGSEYAEGFLRGALIELKDGKIKRCQLTSG